MTSMWRFTHMTPLVRWGIVMVGGVGIVLGVKDVTSRIEAQSLTSPTYTAAQATQGCSAYALHCASCHGTHLDDGEFAPPLRGTAFRQRWSAQSAESLFSYMSTKMP